MGMEYRSSIENALQISISKWEMLVVLNKLEIGSIECVLSNKYHITALFHSHRVLNIGSNEMRIF